MSDEQKQKIYIATDMLVKIALVAMVGFATFVVKRILTEHDASRKDIMEIKLIIRDLKHLETRLLEVKARSHDHETRIRNLEVR